MKLSRWGKPLLLLLSLLLIAAAVSGCTVADNATVAAQTPTETPAETQTETAQYHKITAADAKAMMEEDEAAIVLDVREQSEFDAGHIPGAVLLPVGSIDAKAAEVLTDKNAVILVYCRSGNRSKTAANTLIGMGYTQVYDFGGIIDWPYEVTQAE
jgi:phage shock protein E